MNVHRTPQIRRKYKISSGYEAAIDFSSPTAPSVTYSCSLGSSFRSLSNNADNSLAINFDSPPLSGPIESIAARKKNAEKARLGAVIEKKPATAAKKAAAAEARKVQAAARNAKVVAQKALNKKALKEEQAVKKVEERATKKVETSIEKIQTAKRKAVVPPKDSNAEKKKRWMTGTDIKEE